MKTKTEALEAVEREPLTTIKEGDRVTVDSGDGRPWEGHVGRLKPGRNKASRIQVLDDERDVHLVKPDHVFAPPDLATVETADDDDSDELVDSEGATDELLSEKKGGKDKGFNQYSVKWNDPQTNFELALEDGPSFYGWVRKTTVRKTAEIAYCVDMYARHNEHEFPVESIVYTDGDPRHKPGSVNADICAAANRWWFGRLNGSKQTLDDLIKQSKQPTIHLRHIETMDRIIRQLTEMRNIAIQCGGHRLVQIQGDTESAPMNITMDVSAEAMKLKGKVPPVGISATGVGEGEEVGEGSMGGDESSAAHAPSALTTPTGNVNDLVAQLKITKDPKQQRMIRATLRRMGHRGGARAIEAKLVGAASDGKDA